MTMVPDDTAAQATTPNAVGRDLGRDLGRGRQLSQELLILWFELVNVAFIILAASIAYEFRHDTLVPPSDYLLPILLGALAFAGAARTLRVYHVRNLQSGRSGAARLFGAWVIAWSIVLVACVISKTAEGYSRIWLVLWLMLGLGLLALARAALHTRLSGPGAAERLRERVIVIASMQRYPTLAPLLAPFNLHLVETFPVEPGNGAELASAVARVRSLCAEQPIDRVLLAPALDDEQQMEAFTEATRFLPLEVAILPPNTTLKRASVLHDLPVVEVVACTSLTANDRLLKRMFDLIVGACLLVGLMPLMLLVALAVKLDSPGPVLFPQARGGMGSAHFTMLKFRSMRWADGGAGPVKAAQRDDPRVTRVGRLLRRTSIDELPQLVNVLRGEMSLVGPRPHAVEHDAAFSEAVREYMVRHRVKPGMTGLAQISGARGGVETPEGLRRRIDLDLWYIDHWSLWLDLMILVRTLFHLVGRSVY